MITGTQASIAKELCDADRDDLTKIANRRFFERHIAESVLASGLDQTSTTLLLFDLDRFKAVNDTLGHAAGDALLRVAAARIASQLGDDDVVARLGGDEFGVILHPSQHPAELATRMIELVQRTYLIEGSQVNVGVSIGIASFPADALDHQRLMRCADLALYQAKSSGRNCFVHFEPQMEARAQERREMEVDLRKAIAMRQLEVHYRPHVDVATHRLESLAAVLRWRHPKRGMLDAEAFLPLAEQTGVIVPIGEWLLRAVCRDAAKWPQDVVISLKLSPQQLESSRFCDAVKRALADYHLDGPRLEFEITENILLHDSTAVMKMLERLRSCGIRVAVDSFGTGMASLSQMVNFPLDKIKIARSLVEEQGTGLKERAIVRAIASLGASLGISTVIEGITTPEHLSRIQSDGCWSVQGRLHSEAVPADRLTELVDRSFTPPNPQKDEVHV